MNSDSSPENEPSKFEFKSPKGSKNEKLTTTPSKQNSNNMSQNKKKTPKSAKKPDEIIKSEPSPKMKSSMKFQRNTPNSSQKKSMKNDKTTTPKHANKLHKSAEKKTPKFENKYQKDSEKKQKSSQKKTPKQDISKTPKRKQTPNDAKMSRTPNSAKKSPSKWAEQNGVKYHDLDVGNGKPIKDGQRLKMIYVAKMPNGTIVDKNIDRNNPFVFRFGRSEVIKGWDFGIRGMKIGGKRKLHVPSNLAYGSAGSGEIPPNSPLIFTVNVIGVE